MSFNRKLLTNKILYVRCSSADQVAELSKWAGKEFVWDLRPPVFRFFYCGVAAGRVTFNKPEHHIEFEDAVEAAPQWRVGDRVRCDMMGEGEVIDATPGGRFRVLFGWAGTVTFGQDGTVYGVNGPCKPCLTRVERPVDWSAVKPGTEFVVWGPDGAEVGKRVFRFFAEGKPWFGSTDASVHSWPKYQAVAE